MGLQENMKAARLSLIYLFHKKTDDMKKDKIEVHIYDKHHIYTSIGINKR